ncbi:MAG: TetR/AcrR family transcriptional regulator [Anaerolineae bacterium]|jgi:AcrR family transcriptional regulator|nr:TetR/AcrR family transcriptional regulator [Anaerolineae bacterium]MBT3714176.1 TetR/AcrR family transcriptional regulator [Anaerolineae bacterium]MBT4310775.1 TetR/AcrR family transcriptional regulator [Anaerolineae bacterium]MBT4458227.1 TetR/AcrR family transcriptional regulator [Anaerolineae bacterium]MBT4841018.1 TetR/AcrR family transcriptional regulator [Anaerolineae bacterium]
MTEPILSKGKRTRQAIEEAAYELFLDQGYSATSMRQIAEQAGIALGGIYNHFAGKEAIFTAVILNQHPYKQILPIALAVEGDDVESFVYNTAQALVDELGYSPDFLKLVFIEVVEFGGKHMAALFQDVFPQILPLLERFQSDKVRAIPPVMLMRVFIGTFIAYYLTEEMLGDVVMPDLQEEAMGHFADIFLHGVLKPKEQ